MNANTLKFGLALCAFIAFAQEQERTLPFTHIETMQDMEEIGTAVRELSGIQQASTSPMQRTLKLRGEPGLVALAEWIFTELDKSAQDQQSAGLRELPVPGAAEAVRVLTIPNAASPNDLQEIATVVRSMAGIRYLFTYNAPRTIALRGPDDQLKLAEWLVGELNKPAKEIPAEPSKEFAVPGGEAVRVFYLTAAESTERLQELATKVRSTVRIHRLFLYNALRAMVVRGTPEQLTAAAKMIQERQK